MQTNDNQPSINQSTEEVLFIFSGAASWLVYRTMTAGPFDTEK